MILMLGWKKSKEKSPKHRNAKELILERQLNIAGFGFFHVVIIMVSGLALAADSVEIFGVSFVVPIADKDLGLTTVEKGWLDASIFMGQLKLRVIYLSVVQQGCCYRQCSAYSYNKVTYSFPLLLYVYS